MWRGVAGRGMAGRHTQFHPDASGYVQSQAGVAVAVGVLMMVMAGWLLYLVGRRLSGARRLEALKDVVGGQGREGLSDTGLSKQRLSCLAFLAWGGGKVGGGSVCDSRVFPA